MAQPAVIRFSVVLMDVFKSIYLRVSQGVVSKGLAWFFAPASQPQSRKRYFLNDLLMPGQKTLRKMKGIALFDGMLHFSLLMPPDLLGSEMPPRCLPVPPYL